MKKEIRIGIESHLSEVLLVGFLFWMPLFAFIPVIFHQTVEERLIPIKGHLVDLNIKLGDAPSQNAYSFQLKEFPDQFFELSGLGLADQNILASRETQRAEFTLSILKEDQKKTETPIHVYELSTKYNTFLTLGNALSNTTKLKYVFFILAIASLAGGVLLGRYLKRIILKEIESDSELDLDPVTVWVSGRPKLSIGIVLILSFALQGIYFPYRFLGYFAGIDSGLYLAFLAWYRFSPFCENQFKSILEKDFRRKAHLSEKVPTVAPKHIKAIELLIRRGVSLNIHDSKGKTPLMIAAAAGEAEAVSLLLRKGVNPNLADENGTTALMIAAEKGRLGIVMRLIENQATVNLANHEGLTAVDIAKASEKNKAVLDILIAASLREKAGGREPSDGSKDS